LDQSIVPRKSRQCGMEGRETMQDTEPGKALSAELNRLSGKRENLPEEPDAGNLHVRFCEGPEPTDIGLK
jgi:hypothetical protein